VVSTDRVIIKFIERPSSDNPEEIIRWFCAAFGLSTEKNGIEEQMLSRFMEAAHREMGISSTELSQGSKLARSTIIYHLNRFLDSGLIVKDGRKYYLRATEMKKTIEEIEYDIEREMRRMLDMATEFDRLMQIKEKRRVKGKKAKE
jgi:predicted transcriptional regulator